MQRLTVTNAMLVPNMTDFAFVTVTYHQKEVTEYVLVC